MARHPLHAQLSRFFCKTSIELPAPREGRKQIVICPVSSGIDSTAVAVVMKVLHPEIEVIYLHTDTGIEVDGTADAIQRIEQFTGIPVVKMTPKRDLLQLIEDQGNYLPSVRQRFCTQSMKIRPFRLYIDSLMQSEPDADFVSLVGIRADEPSREGVSWTEGNITSVFPLRQLGLNKEDVNSIVREAVGIPHYYAARTRSGCFTCFFQRRSEVIEVIKREPAGMARAAASECLPEDYKAVMEELPKSLGERLGVSRNWLKMAVPAEAGGFKLEWCNERGVLKRKSTQEDLFSTGNKTLFVAVEHHMRGTQVHYQRVITYSGTMGGLKTSLKFHWLHRLNTKELFQIDTEDSLRSEIEIGLYVVELFDGESLLPEAPADVYTWQSDKQPIALIKKTSYLVEQLLLEEGLLQDARSGDLWAQEQLFKMKGDRTGMLLHGSLYDPMRLEELVTDIDIEDQPVMCNACSR